MADQPASPFSGLDKALIRSTRPTPAAERDQQAPEDAEQSTRRAPRRSASRSAEQDDHSVERTNERTKVRHSFDIYRDQLLELSTIQATIFRETGKKPTVGELVQDALDAYIARAQRRTK
jgi:hypothetical protein